MRLQLTKRTDYAIRACVLLAASDRCPLSSRRIAERMGVPVAFLPQVLGELQRAGFVEAHNGKAGGYCLARAADGVSLLELIEAVEGPVRSGRCSLEPGDCDGTVECALHPSWEAAESAFTQVLATTSLADVAHRWAAGEGRHLGPLGPLAGLESPERIPA